ncbi:hypothetical protein MASR2M74_09050 [Paracoccaceae bacterium]
MIPPRQNAKSRHSMVALIAGLLDPAAVTFEILNSDTALGIPVTKALGYVCP